MSIAVFSPGRLFRYGNFAIGAALTGSVLLTALVSFLWTPHSAIAIEIADKFKPMSATHWFGTDHFGRDAFSLIMVGARNSIAVGVVAVSASVIVGTALGLFASARRGWIEELVMRMSDLAFAFPAVLTAIMITALWGPGAVNAILAIAIFNVPVFARVTRGAGNAVWTREYILAARAAGKGGVRITLQHVLPNILNVLIVQATIQFALAILAEAGLSYLGLGAQPPLPSWGRMLRDAQSYLFTAPEQAIYPGIAIAVAVLGLNLLGDGLRDAFDPRLARKR
jgi:peptide/nickel transport system permease protein